MGEDPHQASSLYNQRNMQIITTIHGQWRWVLAALAIIILVKCAIGLAGKRKPQPMDTTLARMFSIALGIQFLLGIVNVIELLSRGAMYRQAWEHAFTGLIAVALGSMVAPMLRRRGSYVVPLVLVALTLALAAVNVATVRGTWFYG